MTWEKRRPRTGYSDAMRRRVLAEEPECQARLPWICTGWSQEVDHIVSRGEGGSHERDNLRGICSACHRKVTGQQSAKARTAWRIQPERHPGIID